MKSARKKAVNFIATVDEDKITSIRQIASTLANSGVIINQVLPMSGIITGSTGALDQLYQFRSIGLKDIEIDKEKRAL